MTELNIADKHVIAILLDNEFGALARVVSLFSARGYNIETLTVAVVNEKKNLSRVTITTYGDQAVINLILKLLERLIPVHTAVDLSKTTPHIERGLALVKVQVTHDNREEILRVAEIHEAELVDKEEDYFLFDIQQIDSNKLLEKIYAIIQESVTSDDATLKQIMDKSVRALTKTIAELQLRNLQLESRIAKEQIDITKTIMRGREMDQKTMKEKNYAIEILNELLRQTVGEKIALEERVMSNKATLNAIERATKEMKKLREENTELKAELAGERRVRSTIRTLNPTTAGLSR